MTKNSFFLRYEAERDNPSDINFWRPYNGLVVNSHIHYHNSLEIIYARHGTAVMEVNMCTQVKITDGEFFILDENIIHRTAESTDGEFYIMIVPLQDFDIFKELRGDRCFAANKCSDDEYGTFASIILGLYKIRDDLNDEITAYKKVMITALLSGLFMRIGGKPRTDQPNAEYYSIISYINEHIAENFTIKDLSKRFGYTPYGLSEMFDRVSPRMGLKDYIASLRLSKAKQLICSGASAEEAAVASGYGCTRSFYRAFERYEHMTPGEYIDKIKDNT